MLLQGHAEVEGCREAGPCRGPCKAAAPLCRQAWPAEARQRAGGAAGGGGGGGCARCLRPLSSAVVHSTQPQHPSMRTQPPFSTIPLAYSAVAVTCMCIKLLRLSCPSLAAVPRLYPAPRSAAAARGALAALRSRSSNLSSACISCRPFHIVFACATVQKEGLAPGCKETGRFYGDEADEAFSRASTDAQNSAPSDTSAARPSRGALHARAAVL